MKLIAFFLATATLLLADGGSVLLHKQSGPFLITVFGTPQVGPTDFTVLVQNASDRSPILNANVELRIGDFHILATHEAATNKLLYAARIKLAQPGKSLLEVDVTSNGNTAVVDGAIDIAPQSPPILAYWPYFALIPAAILLFALNQWLKNRRAIKRL